MSLSDTLDLKVHVYFLAVDILYGFLSATAGANVTELPLFAGASLLIANKIRNHSYNEFIITDEWLRDPLFIKNELFEMERIILRTLKYTIPQASHLSWMVLRLNIAYTRMFVRDTIPVSVVESSIALMALVSLDAGLVCFSHQTLIQAALHLILKGTRVFPAISNSFEEGLKACIRWMKPFWRAIKRRLYYREVDPTTLVSSANSCISLEIVYQTGWNGMTVEINIDLLNLAHNSLRRLRTKGLQI